MDLAIIDAYVNLASGILLQARKDVDKYIGQKEAKELELLKPVKKRDLGKFVTTKIYEDSLIFLDSEYASYLQKMVIDWKLLMDHLYSPKEPVIRSKF